jgi:hypothetical protein
VVEIIVKKDFSENDIKRAALGGSAYRKQASTSRASNVLDMADLRKTVCLCEDHTRQFASPSVLSKYGYRKFDAYSHCMADCDYCGIFDKCQVFTHESIFSDVWKTRDERRREVATSTVVR